MTTNKNNQIIFALICLTLSLSISIVNGETIIYEEITPSQYKTINIDELGIPFEDMKYTMYVNGSLVGTFEGLSNIEYPDNTTILFHSKNLVNTNVESGLWELSIKPQLYNLIGIGSTWGIAILISLILISYIGYRVYRKITRGY